MSTTSKTDNGLTRRDLFRQTAAAGTTLGALSLAPYSPVGRASASFLSSGVSVATGIQSTLVAPLSRTILGHLLGDRDDHSNYTGENALMTSIEEGHYRLQSTKEQVLSGLDNQANFLRHVLLPKGMQAVAEAVEDDATREEANDRMLEVIDEHIAGIQSDVLKNFESNWNQYATYVERLDEHDNADTDQLWWASYESRQEWDSNYESDVSGWTSPVNTVEWETIPVELADGTTYELEYHTIGSDSDKYHLLPEFVYQNTDYTFDGYTRETVGSYDLEYDESADEMVVLNNAEDVDFQNVAIASWEYDLILDTISTHRGDVVGELSTFVSDMYTYYDPEDLDMSDVVDPSTAYLEFSNEYDNEALTGAFGAQLLGIPRTDDQMVIHLEEDDIEIEGAIYAAEAPGGGFVTDGSVTYDPENLDYGVMVRYTYVTEDGNTDTGFKTLEQPFTILEATDEDGNPVDNVDPEPDVEYDPADIESIEEQLRQIRQLQVELQNQAEEDMDDDGGILATIGNMPTALLIAIVGVAVLVLGGDNDGGMDISVGTNGDDN